MSFRYDSATGHLIDHHYKLLIDTLVRLSLCSVKILSEHASASAGEPRVYVVKVEA